jgi:hypothetical protein
MPSIEAANAAGKVYVPVTVDIFQRRTFALGHVNRRGMREAARNSRIPPLRQRS